MKQFLVLVVLALGVSSFALADPNNQNGCEASGGKPKKCDPISMAEPSALPEFALCLAGIGFLAFRQRKVSQDS
jgi:hypothetical protein